MYLLLQNSFKNYCYALKICKIFLHSNITKTLQYKMWRQDKKPATHKICGKISLKQLQTQVEIQMRLNQEQESLLLSALLWDKDTTREFVCHVKPFDLQEECRKNGVHNLIDTCSQLFLLVKANLEQFKKPFNQIFHFTKHNEIEISVQLLINNLGKQAKRKSIKFVFPTTQLNNIHFLGVQRLQTKVKQLEEQLQDFQQQLKTKKSYSFFDEFQSIPSQIMIRQNTAINLQRNIQFLVLKKSIISDFQTKIQFKTRFKGVLQFKVFIYQNIQQLKDDFDFQESDHTSSWIQSFIGDVITVSLDFKGYQVLLERNEPEQVSIEGEKQMKPTYAYSRLRKAVEFKKLINLQKCHFGIGLPFSAEILMLNMQANQSP